MQVWLFLRMFTGRDSKISNGKSLQLFFHMHTHVRVRFGGCVSLTLTATYPIYIQKVSKTIMGDDCSKSWCGRISVCVMQWNLKWVIQTSNFTVFTYLFFLHTITDLVFWLHIYRAGMYHPKPLDAGQACLGTPEGRISPLFCGPPPFFFIYLYFFFYLRYTVNHQL